MATARPCCQRTLLSTTSITKPIPHHHKHVTSSLPLPRLPLTHRTTTSSGLRRPLRHPLNSTSSTSGGSTGGRPSSTPAATSSSPWPGDKELQSATLIFPATTWSFQKAAPKKSLQDIGQAGNADPWALNVIEAIHWFSFPLGFFTAGFVAVHADKLAPLVGDDLWRVYLLVLGLLSQVFGGGITGNMMHLYEGWQVAPFRNPVALPDAVKACSKGTDCLEAEAEQVFITSYNNAWLRAVAYHLLYFFQSFGICCFSTAVYGPTPLMLALMGATVFAGLVGPHYPRLNLKVNGQPVNPASVAIFAALIVNSLVALPATVQLLGPAVLAGWPPTLPVWGAALLGGAFGFLLGSWTWALPAAIVVGALYALLLWLAPTPVWWLSLLSVVAPLGVAAGGAIEGAVAESTFNQWWHWRAFVVLVTGFGVYGVLYWHLVY